MSNETLDRNAALLAARQELLKRRLQGGARPGPDADAIRPREDAGPAPLSYAQRRLWVLHRIDPRDTTYNEVAAYRLEGALDVGALERALNEVVRRHEVLRSVFVERDGEGVQIPIDPPALALHPLDLAGLPGDAREAAVRERIAAEKGTPFDLAAAPAIRASLLRLAADEHVLVIALHHVVMDGWTRGVLLRELRALYAAFARGAESPLPPLPVQYADFAAWQRRRLDGGGSAARLAWWTEHLAGAPALLELPTDRPRPPVQSFRGARESVRLPAEVPAVLRALGREEGATLFMVLMAAWQVLLHRYSGADDLVVGTPVAGRDRREVEGLIGFFVNTLALRGDLSGDPPFRELLRRTRARAVAAFGHQDVPFERVVEALRPDRSMSHGAVFQVSFVLQTALPPTVDAEGLVFRGLGTERGTAKFDLELEAIDTPDHLTLSLEYAADLFDASTAARMLDHLRTLLLGIAARPDAALSALPLLDDEDRARLAAWNATELPYPRDATVHGLIAEQAARAPDAQAVVFRGTSLTYAELEARANRLAHHLRRLGAGPEARVGICLERSAETVVAMLAVLKTGAAYLPLDPAYPADRLAYMLEDSGAPLLVTQQSLRSLLPADGVRVVSVDEDAAAIAAESTDAPADAADPRNAAYVIYTSGSTGKPKGVQVTHGNAVSFFAGMDARVGDPVQQRDPDSGPLFPIPYSLFPAVTWLAVTRISFDIHVLELLWTLARGFKVVVQPEMDQAREGESFGEQIRRHSVTHLQCTPSLAALVIAESGVQALAPLRRLLLGGEALPADLAAQIRAVLPDGVVNMYGPTETTVWSATHAVDDAAGAVPIGRPIANTRAYVLDAGFGAQPVGVPGELCIAGAGVTRGYHGRAGLTAERFVPDPLAAEPGARMYRTGDRARWRADGTLEFLGRMDFQVKVRGFRVEPGEVESVVREHPRVGGAAVVARDAPGVGMRLVAYATPADGEPPTPAELRAWTAARLPEHMVPSAFVVLDALPRTPNGKLDRRALPEPELQAAADTYVAPRTEAEERVAAIWSEVLGVERVGVDDNFFALGGHSLLATRVVARLRTEMGAELPLRSVFEHPTVAGMAAAAAAAPARRDDIVAPAPAPAPSAGQTPEQKRALLAQMLRARQARADGYPTSLQQQRLWFLDQMAPGNPAYNLPRAYRLRGPLDEAALQYALDELVRRHESLRTVFAFRGGEPVQVITPAAPVAIAREDASGEADPGAAAARLVAAESLHRFDLAAGPLFRAGLARLADGEHLLLLNMHHVVGDGWSTSVLLRELGALYGARAAGLEPPLPALAMQYGDYAAWQRRRLSGEFLERQLDWWRGRLAGAPAVLELPTDRPRPLEQTYRGAVELAVIPPETLEPLRALGRGEGATLYMVLLGAFSLLLSRWSGQDEVVVGSPIAGRTRQELEPLIGFFVNTLALRTDLSGGPTFRALLARVREATLGAYEHQEVPFEKLVEELGVPRSLSHSPVFQTLFALQNYERGTLEMGDLQGQAVPSSLETSKYDLSLWATEGASGLGCSLVYNPDLWDAATMRRLMAHFRTLLESIAADPGRPVAALGMLPAEERARVLEEWNATSAEWPAAATVHGEIAAQAARTPDAPAVVSGGAALAYAELEARANRLAHYLRRLGAGPEARVGICLERSAETVVAMLAVLKTGAAYLPLDPAYPADRLAYMLEDSGAPVLVTQQSLRPLLPADGVRVVSVDDDAQAIAAEEAEAPRVSVDARNAAYVIYTSGSTGKPKGVQVAHGNAVSFFAGMDGRVGDPVQQRAPDSGPLFPVPCSLFPAVQPGTWLAVTRISFDIHVLELLWTLARGFKVVVQPEVEQAGDDEGLAEQIRRHGVTHLQCTPSLAALLIAESGVQALAPLRRLLLGGEALPGALAAQIRTVLPDGLVNMYGPTETTVWSATHAVEDAAGAVPIGRPIANTRVYVLDPGFRPQPVGVSGELFIAGAGVTRGYHGRPGLTAERFVPEPFGAEAGARMYRTGDRARWRADGTLEFLGRMDFQVKVRGFRIEPGEIEAALREHAGVREAAVVVREDAPGDPRLVAYVAAEPDFTDAAARAFLRGRLPEYMVPAAFVPLDALPLTPNGKLDRRALPAPGLVRRDPAEAFVAPRGETEGMVARAWAEALGMEQVGVEDNFFDLGGNSMLLARVAAALNERLGRELRMVELFRHPTVAALAAYLSPPVAAPAPAPERTDEIDRGKNRLFRRPVPTR
jgi:amino acid adenylation domain-containing protein